MSPTPFVAAFVAMVLVSALSGHAETPDVWGKAPPASDDRFTNPAKPLYAGPAGWFNTAEVRATLGKAEAPAYQFQGALTENGGLVIAVKDLLTLTLDFGQEGRPAPGTYAVGGKGDPTAKTVKMSFGDVGGGAIRAWESRAEAGTLTVSLVHGFTVFTARKVALAPAGNMDKSPFPLSVGLEGALSPP